MRESGIKPDKSQEDVSLWLAFMPLLLLFVLLGTNVALYGDDSLSGANQIALILATAFASALSVFSGGRWQQVQEQIVENIKAAGPAILILLMVGALVGSWLVGGVVPTLIYYGLQIFSPSFFIVSCCLLSAIAAIVTGSSWSTSATLGVALMGIGYTLGFNPGLVAGAIISGAYFGDKMSPLSDTTNLASGVCGVELFTHIRYLSLTSLPSIGISLLAYLVLGWFLGSDGAADNSAELTQQALAQNINIHPILLCVPVLVIVFIVRRVPALPAMFCGVLLGLGSAVVFQQALLAQLSTEFGSSYQVLMQALYGSLNLETGNAVLDELLSSGGMGGMLNTIWLIVSAMAFGGAMEATGFLPRITRLLLRRVNSTGALVSASAGTCLLTNVSASDQYLSIVVPGRMFSRAYQQRGLAPQNLSRTLEDSGTVSSVLVPWNTCGAYHAGVLGVATLSYAPWAFFCLISPILTVAFAWLEFKIQYQTDEAPVADSSAG
ncbi:MAG: Na+/H+ antiporter NhaC [Pseudohongiellaceae bacterium]|nr:Na+/H+ antiporter NhaC [Pseudohongiellaceae bacterium]